MVSAEGGSGFRSNAKVSIAGSSPRMHPQDAYEAMKPSDALRSRGIIVQLENGFSLVVYRKLASVSHYVRAPGLAH